MLFQKMSQEFGSPTSTIPPAKSAPRGFEQLGFKGLHGGIIHGAAMQGRQIMSLGDESVVARCELWKP